MRSRRRWPKGGVQAEKQQWYVQLIAQGINNTQACRIVGIDRKTGNRWRYGRSIRNSVGERVHYPRVQIEERRPRSSRYLAEEERVTLADLLSVGRGCPCDRTQAQSGSIDAQSGDPSQSRQGRSVSPASCRAGRQSPRVEAAEATVCDRRCCGQGSLRAARKALESGAGRARAAGAVRRAGAMVVPRVDLPGDL